MAGKVTLWTDANKEKLKCLVAEGKQPEELAAYFGTTKTAIEIKCSRLGYTILRYNRKWTTEDEEIFADLWCNTDRSMQYIMNKLHRNKNGLVIKAQRMGLGPRIGGLEDLTLSTIASEMSVSMDRVRNWVRLGLKCKNRRVGKNRTLVKTEDLLDFLKKHQNLFDASKVDRCLFANEPQWLIDKRRRDLYKETREFIEYSLWTDNMDKQLITMINQGFDFDFIAKKLNKTVSAAQDRARLLGMSYRSARFWSGKELKFLRENSAKMTVKELQKTLKRRTERSIIWKCEQLGYKYHISERMVNKHEKE